MNTLKFGLLALLTGTMLFSSCKKEKEKYGNTKLSSSKTVTLTYWTSDFDDGTNYEFSSTVSWSDISQSVIDKGAVMVYIQQDAEWIALPYSNIEYYNGLSFNFSISTGKVKIIADGFENTGSLSTSDFSGYVVRIVAISPAQIQANPNLDLTDYKAVSKTLHL